MLPDRAIYGANVVRGGRRALFMIFFASHDGKCPVELFQQKDAAHFVGQGQFWKWERFVSPLQDLLWNSQRTSDHKAQRVSLPWQPFNSVWKGFRRILPPWYVEDNNVISWVESLLNGTSFRCQQFFFMCSLCNFFRVWLRSTPQTCIAWGVWDKVIHPLWGKKLLYYQPQWFGFSAWSLPGAPVTETVP